MHSFLIVGATKKGRSEEALKLLEKHGASKYPQILKPETRHYIRDVRRAVSALRLKQAEGGVRGMIVEDAELLTQEAGNAFLKTLEEPLGNTIIILTAPSREAVLETVASRCQIKDLGRSRLSFTSDEEKDNIATLKKLMRGRVGERFAAVDKLSDREKAREFLIGQIVVARQLMLDNVVRKKQSLFQRKKSVHGLVLLLENLEQARLDVEANVNTKLVLTELLLAYPRTVKKEE